MNSPTSTAKDCSRETGAQFGTEVFIVGDLNDQTTQQQVLLNLFVARRRHNARPNSERAAGIIRRALQHVHIGHPPERHRRHIHHSRLEHHASTIARSSSLFWSTASVVSNRIIRCSLVPAKSSNSPGICEPAGKIRLANSFALQ